MCGISPQHGPAARVLDIEIVPTCYNFTIRNPPSVLILESLVPPFKTWLESLKVERLTLGVLSSPLWRRQFVIPDLSRRARTVEKQNVCRDASVGREHTIRQPNNRVKVEVREQLLFDSSAHAISVESPIRHNDCRARGQESCLRRLPQ